MSMQERIGWKTVGRVYKFKDEDGRIAKLLQSGAPIEEVKRLAEDGFLGVEEWEGNVALNEGLQLLIDIIIGEDTTSNKWDSDHANIGVGDGTTSEDASQTGLQGTNKEYEGMDSGYPQRSGQTAIWRATFDGTKANFHWQEFTVVNATDDTGANLLRKVTDKGTKSSGETWTVEIQVTFS